jgi:hypothetical protein
MHRRRGTRVCRHSRASLWLSRQWQRQDPGDVWESHSRSVHHASGRISDPLFPGGCGFTLSDVVHRIARPAHSEGTFLLKTALQVAACLMDCVVVHELAHL